MVPLRRACFVPGLLALASLLVPVSGCAKLKRLSERLDPATSASAVASAAPAPSAAASAASSNGHDHGAPAKPLSGFVRMTVRGVAPTPQGNAVLLVDAQQKRGVPIFVGETEALSIRLRLANRRYPRPLTHDLLDSALDELGAKVEYVRVDKLENNVFFGTVVLTSGKKFIELDARSSDAVAMALGRDVPIFMARPVFDKSAIDLDRIPSEKPRDPDATDLQPNQPDPIAL
jgi:bifunctional DNase/RNase